ncbi:bifunctional metallophosphatase/5'-nucleotidase [Acetilactobacillus jinshanensis]|uniref:Bifunctional metallophosphatase/5'-nucleotidase n=1 Tax=Acetilactobacillus jinshanensis TaxID=1720083 RepID=A0A4P6ZKD8_9LACO|nr:bifunctional UDP-sugar hydrolase/5'-nucleotidase [Acetilactobacillus jinshanensis]QBP18144.1 bifunctional metallophosphatase/5'-nucleotidase [Acetilactobacillus jinshanensis]
MKLHLLLTSDIHGYLAPTNYIHQTFNEPFSLERAATYIKQQQTKDQYTLTFDDGDYLEGSPLAANAANQYNAPKPIDQAFNAIRYDYGIVGNHEFNFGIQYLKNSIRESKRQFLCANITDENDNLVFGKPYAIKQVGPVKVGILGATTAGTPKWELPAHIKGLKFHSLVATAKKYVPIMRKQADVIVVVYHGGFERDHNGKPTEILDGENEGYQLLKEVPGIDALLTGHQHRVIKDHLFGVPVMQVGCKGQYVGNITLDIQNQKVVKSNVHLEPMKGVKPDPALTKVVKPAEVATDNWLNQPLAKVQGNMDFKDPHQARINGCAYDRFIQKMQIQLTHADISANALFTDDSHGFPSPVTIRDIMVNYVYPNKLCLSVINGKILKEAVEQSAKYFDYHDGKIVVSKAFSEPQPLQYLYDLYYGFDYVINVAKPIGHRVTKLTYHGKPVRPDQQFKMTMNNYRAVGGGFPMFNKHQIKWISKKGMPQIIAEYLKEHPVIKADSTHNMKVIYQP